jgi:hypothetical protein
VAKRLFNSEVNLVTDLLLEHRPKKLSNKRYKGRKKLTLTFVFQEDPQFELTGRTVQVKDDVSTIESGVKIQPLSGAEFINLSDYNIVEITNPTYSGVAMGMSKINTWTRTRIRESLPLNSVWVWIIGRAFTSTIIFTTLLYLVYPKKWMTIPSYFTSCFLPTESTFQCVLDMLFVSILLLPLLH